MTVKGVPLYWEPPVKGADLWAVSVWEPWATAILDGGCDVINRQWHAAPHRIEKARMLIDHTLLLHAGGKFNRHEVEYGVNNFEQIEFDVNRRNVE